MVFFTIIFLLLLSIIHILCEIFWRLFRSVVCREWLKLIVLRNGISLMKCLRAMSIYRNMCEVNIFSVIFFFIRYQFSLILIYSTIANLWCDSRLSLVITKFNFFFLSFRHKNVNWSETIVGMEKKKLNCIQIDRKIYILFFVCFAVSFAFKNMHSACAFC